MPTVKIKIGAFVKEHLKNIMEYLDKHPEHVSDLINIEYTKETFSLGGNKYPFMSYKETFKDKKTYRCWSKPSYKADDKEYYFNNQWGSSIAGEERGELVIKYLKSKDLLLKIYKNIKIEFIVGNNQKTPVPMTSTSPFNQILYGPPGTGKTYSTVGKALEILKATKKEKQNIKSIGGLKEVFKSQVEFVTFHQSFSYEDFVEGLKAKTDDGKLSYEVEDGIFKKICKDAVNSGNDSLKQLNKMIKALKEQVAKEPLELITVTYKKSFTLTYNGGKGFSAKPKAGKEESSVSISSLIELYKNPTIKDGEGGMHFTTYAIPVIKYLKDELGLLDYQETASKK
jgi:hypothetical protein